VFARKRILDEVSDPDLEITTVGLGAWAIGGGKWEFGWGPQDDQQSIAAIRAGLDLGINWIVDGTNSRLAVGGFIEPVGGSSLWNTCTFLAMRSNSTAIECGGRTKSTWPDAAALRGMAEYLADFSSCARVIPPFALMACRPNVPSVAVPERITPMAWLC